MPFDEEELDPHGECRAEIKRLRAALKLVSEQAFATTDANCIALPRTVFRDICAVLDDEQLDKRD